MAEVKKIATRESYGNTLKELAAKNPDVIVLDADLAAATTTGINSHVFDIWKKDKIYTIDGKKVSEAKHGLFIVNGKKVLVK